MKILIVARGYPSKKYNLNGIFEFDQAKALVKSGHEVIFAAIDMRSIRRWRNWGYESFVKDGVIVEAINIPCGKVPNKILNITKKFALKNLYTRIYKKYGHPDIIHAHFIGSGYIVAQVFENSRIPLILTEHYSEMNKSQLSLRSYNMGRFTYPRMNKVIAVSSNLANNIKEKFNIEVKVIPNIVDLANFKYSLTNKSVDKFNFVSTGNLVSNKRMDILIESFSSSFKNNKNICLYIFGDGPERVKLEKMVHYNEMEDQIFLMGRVDRKVIANKMAESHCFVLVSRSETFGVAYIEAMAMGLPVIATRCGGPEDFINKQNGILVPVDDVVELKKALRSLYDNIEIFDKESISKQTINLFSSQNIVDKLSKIYQNAILDYKMLN